MALTILRYSNRKLYIPQAINKEYTDQIKVGRYITLAQLKAVIGNDTSLRIYVKNYNGMDITKTVLLNCLRPHLFSETDLYNLVRKQFLEQFVRGIAPLEIPSLQTGAEL